MNNDNNGRDPNTSPALSKSSQELDFKDEEDERQDKYSDTCSLLSEDSVFPDYEDAPSDSEEHQAVTLYWCCVKNNAQLLQDKLNSGVTREEAMELDINGKNGLLVACFRGFKDIVILLSKCSYIDVNHQDNDGNTALMVAAQAGHITILNYLLNYYPGVDIEMQDDRGLTALMKAAIRGKNDCVAALLMAGADIAAVDPVKGKTAQEWAAMTGCFETIMRIRILLQRPCAQQFSNKYLPEWPHLPELVAQATASKSRAKRLSDHICSMFTIRFPQDPETDGVMDHMVRMTTSLASPFVTTACQTLCPDSPPELGKQRHSVPEILNQYVPDPDAKSVNSRSCSSSQFRSQTLIPYQSPSPIEKLLSLPMRFNSTIPKIKYTKSSAQSTPEENKPPKVKNKNALQVPKWRYKELKEKKKNQ
ncbi:photoreceptor ankyrin repeat protein [Pseudonaja textilis]|uniref:photoreceptor ankyrin repeat protein n=1 Tax=Pseudonaja textilis TaxID=8673 RepID=UPI000EA8B75B|nr:photoreceptor ankyrin repeat protein [Pseudonaja textilis]